ncbi:uncharacterized protein RCC_01330 [Ramularia collo-cygni]|uniref:Uncharacterized protein n=1 Tax=Ramularia collo-cygni TaxID=112498 RepID=A0A2D3UZ67_9PEZI|nr:uncharacterized protein RCC_01330 [Ramularia collo-cygni]CZT15474.1 uncharacterized protein RCC_01330 [Ramularia collo-cygni]
MPRIMRREDAYLIESATALKALCQDEASSLLKSNGSSAPTESRESIAAAEQKLYASLYRTTALLAQPRGFLFQLASHVQLLACLKWLGEFQVLACVPVNGCISVRELSALADAPEHILCRVVRLTATAGFLHESERLCVAHTAFSAAYTEDLSSSDAAMFLAKQIAPAALQFMAASHQCTGASMTQSVPTWNPTGYNFAAVQDPFAKEPQAARQWAAYCRSVSPMDDYLATVLTDKGHASIDLVPLLGQLEWPTTGITSIIQVCTAYNETSASLAKMSPDTQIVVQTYETPSLDSCMTTTSNPAEPSWRRIDRYMRQPNTPQQVKNATAYILQPEISRDELESLHLLACELKAHLDCLRINPTAFLIVAPRLLPQPGSVAVQVEAGARLRDFACVQLNNQCALEVDELAALIDSTANLYGRPVVITHMRDQTGATVALAVKFDSLQSG